MGLMKVLDGLMKPFFKIIIKNRWGYTEEEFQKAGAKGFFDMLNLEAMRYWLVAQPVCSSHCMGCHNEGRPFYFNPMGLLIRHKCPPGICIHGLSQLSPVIYTYWDLMLQGKDPNRMAFDHVACTDIGLNNGGLGDNMFRVRREKMPFVEFIRFMWSMAPYLVVKNKRARGEYRAAMAAPTSGGPSPDEFMQALPISPEDLDSFLASPKRAARLSSFGTFKHNRIVIRVISSQACIAGHRQNDEFYLDAMGRVLHTDDQEGICILALAKIWWRVMLVLEGMAAAGQEADFKSALYDLPMSCYSAGLPLGACGQIMMQVEIRTV